jgi:hypothetical protein
MCCRCPGCACAWVRWADHLALLRQWALAVRVMIATFVVRLADGEGGGGGWGGRATQIRQIVAVSVWCV